MVQITRLTKDMGPQDPKSVEQRDDYYLRFANYEQNRHEPDSIALLVFDYKHRKILTYYSDATYRLISHKGYQQVMDVIDIPNGVTTDDVSDIFKRLIETESLSANKDIVDRLTKLESAPVSDGVSVSALIKRIERLEKQPTVVAGDDSHPVTPVVNVVSGAPTQQPRYQQIGNWRVKVTGDALQ